MGLLSDGAVQSDPNQYRRHSKALSEIQPIVERFRDYKTVAAKIGEARELAGGSDAELKELAEQELSELETRRDDLLAEIRLLMVPKDPNDEKNVVLEIRAGTGGDEAGLFAGDLFRMYSRFAEGQRWKVDVLSINESGVGAIKEVIALIKGTRVYSRLKYESGVHRVQRVPATEASGRIHTSTVTVAVLPEAEEVDIAIDPKDLRIDTFCSSGPGGQHVNTTYSAVRITHLPTGLVVSQQDEKSQIKNKAKALKVLRSRLYEMELQRQHDEIAEDRKSQVGTGERSEKIRTYNFPQNRSDRPPHRFHYPPADGGARRRPRRDERDPHHALPGRGAEGRRGGSRRGLIPRARHRQSRRRPPGQSRAIPAAGIRSARAIVVCSQSRFGSRVGAAAAPALGVLRQTPVGPRCGELTGCSSSTTKAERRRAPRPAVGRGVLPGQPRRVDIPPLIRRTTRPRRGRAGPTITTSSPSTPRRRPGLRQPPARPRHRRPGRAREARNRARNRSHANDRTPILAAAACADRRLKRLARSRSRTPRHATMDRRGVSSA